MALLDLQHDYIGVFDSGIGGLTVANAVCRLLPDHSLLYLADNARAPYGSHTPAEVQTYSYQITEQLLAAGARIILLACNTATSRAIEQLRATFPDIPFVGIEPAVKPAAAATQTAVIGVLATRITLGSERYHRLTNDYARTLKVLEDPCTGLVSLIENGADERELRPLLQRILHPMLEQGADTIVLGCTHYPLVADHIADICGPAVQLIDPAAATARQLARLARELLDPPAPDCRYDFLATAAAAPLQRTLLQLPDLNRKRALLAGRIQLT